ncbi:hypothetical protein Q5741_00750 [Paenibacillus sp. JX-17]|uniref:Methyltransferase n=1 Tax=Paenibacillus lacisoli TaxID=3064525 RepID=A0ABT9C6P5_9BACL|nr:hypothetical protein [Paenibacillus sp. JX-17]MDO7904937.1 hypothetical protein [Paenibacillus sp. JX-17]
MARSFERKVRKNTNQLNQQRKKQGLKTLGNNSESADLFRGRSITAPALLAFLAVFYLLLSLFVTKAGMKPMDWFVFVLYLLLGVIFYFRRPYLKVGKKTVYTLKSGRERSMSADMIKSIKVQRGYIFIESEGKKSNWGFSRTLNRYDISAMSERLEKFAKENQIPFEREEK